MRMAFISVLAFFSFIFSHSTAQAKPTVLVTIAPHKFFVEKIGGSTVEVQLMIPAGADAHTYEPTPRQVMSANSADIWFFIGEAFEARAKNALLAHKPSLLLVDMRQGLEMISATSCCQHHQGCCHASGEDLHFWLSPKEAQQQAKTIASALIEKYPANTEVYKQNLLHFLEELEALDARIRLILKEAKNRVVMVAHPAYAYFARDYQLTQLPIEHEGKDPSPQQLTKVIKHARKEKIKTVFSQAQYSHKVAQLIANEINAQVVILDPYAENYLCNLERIAHSFAEN
ncbi:zinc ABC transporter substrate-binding protein [Parachlamydia sp. AcF125]|uniref:metal ABC transporter solute-binding protein, Zn/Mn family n=1 Tax=Parachlamydia sp. AcF125 TaxID=2795736 RepID=UPI001BC96C60|nr:zinc ABC transporter substrate-binding protein [Parachlamydia sp. AcF125]MBS4167585.1 High-affinity zinc uptake system binding-protein ZnuA [Parachlamydia sp. AcF125]